MALLSFLPTYNPSIEVSEDQVAELDAEINVKLLSRTRVTSYPTENGQMVSNSVVLLPNEIRFSWGIGVRRVLAAASTDAVEALKSNFGGYIGGFASNFISSGLGSFALGLLSDSLLNSDKEASRAFAALKVLQAAQISATPLAITINGLGTLHKMVATELELNRKGKDGGVFVFDITLSQIQTGSKDGDTVTELKKPSRLGNITGLDVDDPEWLTDALEDE